MGTSEGDEVREQRNPTRRREFGRRVAAVAGSFPLAATVIEGATMTGKRMKKVKLGFDNYAVREFGWKAPKLLDYAASQQLDSLLLSDLFVYDDHSEPYLKDLKAKADNLGIEIQVGTGGICPTSDRRETAFGDPEDHLRLTLRIAATLGSSVARCFLGGMDDRKDPEGIEQHIESTIAVLRKVRGYALDLGVKIGVENHAGDLQARELVGLIEAAGKDYVGATVDAGNATWTLEDPVRNLEILAPYAVSSGIRDSMVWEDGRGARVQWTAMGNGCVDTKSYAEKFAALCPDVPFQLEIISGVQRSFPYLDPAFWSPYENARATDFAAFLALAKRGRPIEAFEAPAGPERGQAVRNYQKTQLERSIKYCKEVLGLGLK